MLSILLPHTQYRESNEHCKKYLKFGLTEIEVFQSLVYRLTYNWLRVPLSRYSLFCVALCRSYNIKLWIATWSVSFAIFLASSYDPCQSKDLPCHSLTNIWNYFHQSTFHQWWEGCLLVTGRFVRISKWCFQNTGHIVTVRKKMEIMNHFLKHKNVCNYFQTS